MKRKFNIDKEIEDTLRALDGIERIPHNPYFYTKLQERLVNERKKKSGFSWINLWQPAFFAVLIIINIISFNAFQHNAQQSEDGLSILKSEYKISDGMKKEMPLF